MTSASMLASLFGLLALAGTGLARADSPVGISISAQDWNPLHPEADTPVSLLDSPAAISGPMNAAWDVARKAMMDAVPKILDEYDLGGGFRLHGVQFNVNALGPITLASVAPVPAGAPSPLRLHWTIPATHISVLLRTPGPAPSSTDPGFSASVDLDLAVALAISDTPGQTFKVTEVRIAVPQGGFHFQSDNPTGDIPVALVSFGTELVTGKSLNGLLNLILDDQNFAAGQKNALAQYWPTLKRIDLAGMANQELIRVNQAVKVPANYVHIGQWLKPANGGQTLSLVFAPRNLPLPPATGKLAGSVNFAPGKLALAQALPPTCAPAQFAQPQVQVQTGPRPVLDAAPFRYGEAPVRSIDGVKFTTGTLDVKNRRCDYQIAGLISAWPNQIVFTKPSGSSPSPYVANLNKFWDLAPEGWSSPVLPGGGSGLPLNRLVSGLAHFDLLASYESVGGAGVGAVKGAATKPQPANSGDPAYRTDTFKNAAELKSVAPASQIRQIQW